MNHFWLNFFQDYFVFLNGLEGTLVLRKALDYETQTNFTVTLRAQVYKTIKKLNYVSLNFLHKIIGSRKSSTNDRHHFVRERGGRRRPEPQVLRRQVHGRGAGQASPGVFSLEIAINVKLINFLIRAPNCSCTPGTSRRLTRTSESTPPFSIPLTEVTFNLH